MLIWLQLFWEFFKTGLFAVGGGLATLPFLYRMSAATGWFTFNDIADLIAVSESTPGPLGVNMATYVGFKSIGLLGGVVSTLGLVCPSIIVIIIISKVLDKFKEAEVVKKVFYGLRPASTALIAAAGLGVAKIALLNVDLYEESKNVMDLFHWPCLIMAVVIFAVMKYLAKHKIAGKKLNLHPIVYIAISAVLGVLLQL
ncbi:MAG: chromate transporter [Dorea sp.]|nr:chromate transporter [Dorea sp.]